MYYNFIIYMELFLLLSLLISYRITVTYRLRNLSGDSCSTGGSGGGGTTTSSTSRYHLAEHRYGREEMLALFDRNNKPPEPLTTFSALYVEKTQLPLALIQMTEDETVTARCTILYLYRVTINKYMSLILKFQSIW